MTGFLIGCDYEAKSWGDYLDFIKEFKLSRTHWQTFFSKNKEENMWAVVEKHEGATRVAYFQDGARKSEWEALSSPTRSPSPEKETPTPEPKKEKGTPTPEERMMYAFGHGSSLAEEFLKYFEGSAKGVFQNYKRLSIEQGVLEQFEANPLVTIVTMQPGCCFHIATRFLDGKMTT